MIVASYGGGTNSTAMLIGMVEKGEPVDLILFADTGGEKPHTYRYVDMFSDWLKANGMPEIITVREDESLEKNCLRRNALPGIAYGFKSCSEHYKIRPQNRYLKKHGIKVTTKLIGFDADEPYRAKEIQGNRYPLIEWWWGREDCIEAIERSGLPLPGKSSCFFCPSCKPNEIRQLRSEYPDLAQRAIAMERNAELSSVKGLGRSWSWESLLATADMFETEREEFFHSIEIDCGCYDG